MVNKPWFIENILKCINCPGTMEAEFGINYIPHGYINFLQNEFFKNNRIHGRRPKLQPWICFECIENYNIKPPLEPFLNETPVNFGIPYEFHEE
jgi:hypothetical protein